MKKQRHNPTRKTTATKTEIAQSRITPMNSTVPSAISVSCAVFAPITYTSQISACLRSLWSRLEMRLRDLQVADALKSIRWRIKWSIAWLRRYSLNLALFATIIALVAFLAVITWLHLTLPHIIKTTGNQAPITCGNGINSANASNFTSFVFSERH